MAEIPTELPQIRENKPRYPDRLTVTPHMLEAMTSDLGRTHQTMSLMTYEQGKVVQERAAGRSTTAFEVREKINPHYETFIIERPDGTIEEMGIDALREAMSGKGMDFSVVGVSRWKNAGNNQIVEARVHGVNPDKEAAQAAAHPGELSVTGYERPTTIEGPHMDLALYAIDDAGVVHVFRTIQLRQGKAVLDTVRGFASAKEREDGIQMYDVTNAQGDIARNIQRILKEEAGHLKVEETIYLGTTIPNTTFVDSQTAYFAVKVDYIEFLKAQNNVISIEEAARRQEALEHEGIVDKMIDLTLPEYLEIMRNSGIPIDATANYGTAYVAMEELARMTDELSSEREQRSQLKEKNARLEEEFAKERRRFWPRREGIRFLRRKKN